MEINYLDKIDLFNVRKTTRKNYFVDVESSTIQTIDVTEKYDREDLLKNSYFLSYAGHELNRIGSITLYNVVDRVIDEKRNLIVFVKVKTRDIEKP